MGNKQSTLQAKDTKNGSDDEGDDVPEEEQAESFIELEMFVELPSGTQNAMKVTVNPDIKVSAFKEDLSPLMNIVAKNIRIYRHQLPKSEMPDHSTLRNLNVTNHMQLRVRDGSKKYINPIVNK